jgi:hypothetical protein
MWLTRRAGGEREGGVGAQGHITCHEESVWYVVDHEAQVNGWIVGRRECVTVTNWAGRLE